MDNISIIKNTLNKLISSELKEYKNITLDSYFIGPNSEIDSIDIMSSLAFIEDNLEEKGISEIDLFDEIFKYKELTFNQLIDLIINLI